MRALQNRIDILERRVRHLAVAAAALGMFLLVLIGASTTQDKVAEIVRAKRFEVVNDQGQIVGLFSVSEHGGRLDIKTSTGTNTTTIAQGESGDGSILVTSKRGTPMVSLGTETYGDGLIEIFSKFGWSAVVLGADFAGGELEVLNKSGRRVCSIEVDRTRSGKIEVWAHQRKLRTLTQEAGISDSLSGAPEPLGSVKTRREARKALKVGLTGDDVRSMFGLPDSWSEVLNATSWLYKDLFGFPTVIWFTEKKRVRNWHGM